MIRLSLPTVTVTALLALVPSIILVPSVTLAQTAVGGVPSTPPKVSGNTSTNTSSAANTSPSSSPSLPPAPPMAVSEAVLKQAADQIDGKFPPMTRAGAGGQIQEVWNGSSDHDGIHEMRLCEQCIYKVRTREMMTTTLVLPEDAVIVNADIGDPVGFQVQVRSASQIAVRPAAYGIDTNLNVYTKSGRIYPFYVRSEAFNSNHIPDLLVRILGRETPPKIETVEVPPGVLSSGKDDNKTALPLKPGDKAALAVQGLMTPEANPGDFVRTVAFDPAQLHGWNEYKLWGDDELKPVMVFRDQKFTYIQYGKLWDSAELPSAFVTVDKVDELINTRVQGSTFIIEATAPLITLKLGKKYLCVQYTGETP